MLKSTNEDIKSYLPGSPEKKSLKAEIEKLENQHFEIPIIINGKEYKTDHFKLTSKDTSLPEDKKLNFDIWLDKKTLLIVKVSYERMGNWEYRLKNLE